MSATYFKIQTPGSALGNFFFFFFPVICVSARTLLAATDLGEIWDGHRRSQGRGRHGHPCKTLA